MMEPKKLVADQLFNEVEDAKAHQERVREELAGPANVVLLGVAPQDRKTKGGEHIGAGVKDAIQKVFTIRFFTVPGG